MLNRVLVAVLALSAVLGAGLIAPRSAEAHQPYCEFADLTFETAWQVPDASISYAYYANLYPADDVDYFQFEADAGQDVFISMTIPDIEGQEDFVPMMAIFGPGLDADAGADVPARVTTPDGTGALVVPMIDEPEHFFEPFGRRHYWQWQETTFTAPEAAAYTVAVWHPEQTLGRYTFVIGKREVIGGQLDCLQSMGDYWTRLAPGRNPYRDGGEDMDMSAHAHQHDELLDVSGEEPVPSVEVQLFSLGGDDYNVFVNTENFRFAPWNVDLNHAPGEGHAHLYIDGVKITRLYGAWYFLENVPEGAQVLRVALYANDHRALAVGDQPIEATVAFADVPVHDHSTHQHGDSSD